MRQPPTRGLEAENEVWRQDIERNLDQAISVNFDERGITEVVAFLQRNTNVNFVLDPDVAALEPIVSMQLSDVRLRNALEFIMLQTDLTYALQNEAVYISTDDGLRGDAYTRVYDVRDLTMSLTSFPGPRMEIPDPQGDGARLLPETTTDEGPQAGDFMDIILEVVSPESWDADGVAIDEYNGSLVVAVVRRASAGRRTPAYVAQPASCSDQRQGSLPDCPRSDAGRNRRSMEQLQRPCRVPAPLGAGANPTNPTVTPPWWFGGYLSSSSGNHIYAGQITNNLWTTSAKPACVLLVV